VNFRQRPPAHGFVIFGSQHKDELGMQMRGFFGSDGLRQALAGRKIDSAGFVRRQLPVGGIGNLKRQCVLRGTDRARAHQDQAQDRGKRGASRARVPLK
jgi:hypothetical protein